MSGMAQNGKLIGSNMNKIHLNGADPDKIAELIGGTLVLHNTTDDIALISGGDLSKLEGTESEATDE